MSSGNINIYCPECGTANELNAKKCYRCGATFPTVGTKPNYGDYDFAAEVDDYHLKPTTYIGWNIFLTCCCCPPLGLLGIIFGASALSSFSKDKYERADKYSKYAYRCLIWGLILGILLWGFLILYE